MTAQRKIDITKIIPREFQLALILLIGGGSGFGLTHLQQNNTKTSSLPVLEERVHNIERSLEDLNDKVDKIDEKFDELTIQLLTRTP
jgi:peptidoglycan hydrolase CwlO-like protein